MVACRRVDYNFTLSGKELIPEMERLRHWGSRHFGNTPDTDTSRQGIVLANSLQEGHYFLTAKNTMRRIASKNKRFNNRISGIYCDNFDGSAAEGSGGFGIGGRVVFCVGHG